MRDESFERALGQLRRRRPFRPFTVELFGGNRIVVSHPEALAVFDDMAAFSETDGVQRFFDSASVLQLYSIAIPPVRS